MKYILFFIITLFFFTEPIMAQPQKFERILGFRFGGNVSTYHSEKTRHDFQWKPGFYLGAFGGRQYKKWGFGMEMNYETKGALKSHDNWDYRTAYLSLSPIVHFRLPALNSRVLLGGYGGVRTLLIIDADHERLASYTADGFKSFDAGMLAGIQTHLFYMKQTAVSFELRANYGLIDMHRSSVYPLSEWDSKWDRNLSINAGIYWVLKGAGK